MNLFRERDSKIGVMTEAVGGTGASGVVRVESDAVRDARKKRLITVGYVVALF